MPRRSPLTSRPSLTERKDASRRRQRPAVGSTVSARLAGTARRAASGLAPLRWPALPGKRGRFHLAPDPRFTAS